MDGGTNRRTKTKNNGAGGKTCTTNESGLFFTLNAFGQD
ncbi:hypothetical protein L914_01546 [Phytophthora nicotianae]|uniref:Uncharacterized protein n=2 Tax=Phytophthora nicotianae TaxID=4792 RepID=V9FW36_PHYNI|nr:hypothetical protein F443_01639 [Phytophthora nicotianae P1569]ETM55207.1 hypothetical protein L914_01546 [Phytophthora nicotianae]